MLKDSLKDPLAGKRWQDNPLVLHLRPFATALIEDGYADNTMQSKLWLLADLGQWLERSGLSVTDLDEQLVETFINDKQGKGRARRGDLETLRQFLDHLRRRDVVSGPKPVCDESTLADILNRYEKHLRSERGLVTATIINYQPFVRKFLVERFREGTLLVREVRSSDLSAFVLRHAHTMSPGRAQL